MLANRSLQLLFPALAAAAVAGCAAPAPETTPGAQTLAVATAEATARGVPVLIDFYTDW